MSASKRKHSQSVCEECPLYDERPMVLPTLLGDVTLAIVGEAPSRQDVVQGHYWVGAPAKLLFESLKQIDITREMCSSHVATLCYPPKRKKSLAPTEAEIDLCARRENRLKDEILAQNPQLILALGNSALIALFGDKGQGIAKERRKLREWNGIKVLPTIHPSSILFGGGQFHDFGLDLELIPDILADTIPEHVLPEVTVLHTEGELDSLIAALSNKEITDLSMDVETTGFNYFEDRALCMSLSTKDGARAFVLAEELCTKELLTRLMATPGVTWSEWNGMFDTQMVRTWTGKTDLTYDDDPMLMSYALDERQGVHGLKFRTQMDLGAPDYEREVQKYLPTKKTSYAAIPKDILYKYAGYDAAYTQREKHHLWNKMDEKQRMFYRTVLMPGASIVLDMEREGMLIDQEALTGLRTTYAESLAQLETEMFEIVGREFNPRSPQQVSRILYSDLGLPKPPRSASEAATDKDALAYNRSRHALIPAMERYRSEHKTYSTYVVGLDDRIWADGRVHASYLLHGSVSRTSCRDPNIQNIPRDGPVKDAFIAPEGWEFFWPDFSQHEYRMVAVYSGDEWLKEVFNSGRSLHKEMAVVVYGEGYNETEYVRTKNVNFGLLFGRTAYSLTFQLGKTERECQEFLDETYDKMPMVRPWHEDILSRTLQGEDMVSKLGRYRRFGLITPANLKHTRNEIYNFYPQGTGSDTALVTMHDTWQDQGDPDWLRPCAFIHDGLGFYIKKGYRDRIPELVRQMADTPQRMLNTDVQFRVEVKVGDTWGSLSDLNLETLKTKAEMVA